MKKFMLYMAAVICAGVMTGCINVEYIGQDFPALPDNRSVLIFTADNEVPAGEFKVIGKMKMTVPPGVDMVIVREKIAEEARAHGASAARIVSAEQVLVNRYYGAARQEAESPMLTSRSTVGPMATNPDGSPVAVNSFGEVVEPNRTYRERYEHVVKVQLLMSNQDYNRAVELRRRAAEQKEQ